MRSRAASRAIRSACAAGTDTSSTSDPSVWDEGAVATSAITLAPSGSLWVSLATATSRIGVPAGSGEMGSRPGASFRPIRVTPDSTSGGPRLPGTNSDPDGRSVSAVCPIRDAASVAGTVRSPTAAPRVIASRSDACTTSPR